MPSASTIRLQVEAALAHKIPSALTPAAQKIRPVAATGIDVLDALLAGGLPIGAVTELIGSDCSGRTSVAASFLARLTRASKVSFGVPWGYPYSYGTETAQTRISSRRFPGRAWTARTIQTAPFAQDAWGA